MHFNLDNNLPGSTTKKFDSPLIPLSPMPVRRNPVTVSFSFDLFANYVLFEDCKLRKGLLYHR